MPMVPAVVTQETGQCSSSATRTRPASVAVPPGQHPAGRLKRVHQGQIVQPGDWHHRKRSAAPHRPSRASRGRPAIVPTVSAVATRTRRCASSATRTQLAPMAVPAVGASSADSSRHRGRARIPRLGPSSAGRAIAPGRAVKPHWTSTGSRYGRSTPRPQNSRPSPITWPSRFRKSSDAQRRLRSCQQREPSRDIDRSCRSTTRQTSCSAASQAEPPRVRLAASISRVPPLRHAPVSAIP